MHKILIGRIPVVKCSLFIKVPDPEEKSKASAKRALEKKEEEEMVESTGVFQEGEEEVSCTTKPDMTFNL